MPRKSTSSNKPVATIGIDIGKNSFHRIGLDKAGAIVLQAQLSRGQIGRRFANLPPCLVGMESCSGAHFIGRMPEHTNWHVLRLDSVSQEQIE